MQQFQRIGFRRVQGVKSGDRASGFGSMPRVRLQPTIHNPRGWARYVSRVAIGFLKLMHPHCLSQVLKNKEGKKKSPTSQTRQPNFYSDPFKRHIPLAFTCRYRAFNNAPTGHRVLPRSKDDPGTKSSCYFHQYSWTWKAGMHGHTNDGITSTSTRTTPKETSDQRPRPRHGHCYRASRLPESGPCRPSSRWRGRFESHGRAAGSCGRSRCCFSEDLPPGQGRSTVSQWQTV
jgi:hypothetical protein